MNFLRLVFKIGIIFIFEDIVRGRIGRMVEGMWVFWFFVYLFVIWMVEVFLAGFF